MKSQRGNTKDAFLVSEDDMGLKNPQDDIEFTTPEDDLQTMYILLLIDPY